MAEKPSRGQAVSLGQRVLARCREGGCVCTPIIRVDWKEDAWWVDVTHQAHCPHEESDEYLEKL